MCSKGLFKRILPFFATFAVGLFIASFFVSISGPRFGLGERRMRRFEEMQRIRVDNEELRNENLRLRNEMESMRFGSGERRQFQFHMDEMTSPDVSVPVPLPPPPPRVRR